jgi:hypothetical protein
MLEPVIEPLPNRLSNRIAASSCVPALLLPLLPLIVELLSVNPVTVLP